jgi:hypothetical protein
MSAKHNLPLGHVGFGFCCIALNSTNFLYSYDSLLQEFAKKYIFGFSIASSFLNLLHVPLEMSFEEMANTTLDHMINDAYTRGGESVNKELRGMIYEIYKLHEKFNLKL